MSLVGIAFQLENALGYVAYAVKFAKLGPLLQLVVAPAEFLHGYRSATGARRCQKRQIIWFIKNGLAFLWFLAPTRIDWESRSIGAGELPAHGCHATNDGAN
jgi:hypothetical protein